MNIAHRTLVFIRPFDKSLDMYIMQKMVSSLPLNAILQQKWVHHCQLWSSWLQWLPGLDELHQTFLSMSSISGLSPDWIQYLPSHTFDQLDISPWHTSFWNFQCQLCSKVSWSWAFCTLQTCCHLVCLGHMSHQLYHQVCKTKCTKNVKSKS